jgi:hypothetical protein
VKLYEQCVKLYAEMLKQSVLQAATVNYVASSANAVLVYRGFLSILADDIGIGASSYTPVIRRLELMQCAERLLTGKRNNPSVWLLKRAPTPELFEASRSAPQSRLRALEARIEKLERLLVS